MSITALRMDAPLRGNYNELEVVDDAELRNKLIQEVALSTLKDIAASCVITGVTCYFVATSAIPTLLIGAISMIAMNLVLRSLSAGTLWMIYHEREHNPLLLFAYQLSQCMCPISFSILESMTTSVVIHEAGHALAATAVYNNSHASIEIFPFLGGVTRYYEGALTKFGEHLGPRASRLFVNAAGPLAGILAASCEIGLSHYVKEDHPQLSLYLLSMGVMTVAQHVMYALSALSQELPSPGHDFVGLWKVGGIHPLTSVVCMLALPLLVKTTLFSIDYYHRS
ncbi:hypothetical protein [Candidatus Protochlamydia naegleriophila]|nr:hypothetical protein [Candidatus Protochlamydia naegleriophila]